MSKPPPPFFPKGRIVELHELTPEDIEKIMAPLPPSPDAYNLEDLDDDGKLKRPVRKYSDGFRVTTLLKRMFFGDRT